MTLVQETLQPTVGVDPAALVVQVALAGNAGKRLPAGYATVEGTTIATEYRLHPDSDGNWELELPSNEDIEPQGTAWMVTLMGYRVDRTPRYFFVPQVGPCEVVDCLTDPPGVIDTGTTALLQAQLANLPKVQATESIGIDDQTTPGWLALYRRAMKCTGVILASTATETSMIDPAVPATGPNRLGLHSLSHLRVSGTYYNNTGANRNITFRARINGDMAAEAPITAIPSSASPRSFFFDCHFTFGEWFGMRTFADGIVNMGPAATTGTSFASGLLVTPGLAVVDFTENISWDFTAQHSFASADLSVSTISVIFTYTHCELWS